MGGQGTWQGAPPHTLNPRSPWGQRETLPCRAGPAMSLTARKDLTRHQRSFHSLCPASGMTFQPAQPTSPSFPPKRWTAPLRGQARWSPCLVHCVKKKKIPKPDPFTAPRSAARGSRGSRALAGCAQPSPAPQGTLRLASRPHSR